jgi:hypothetical protein
MSVAAVALCLTFVSNKVEAHSLRSANSFLLGCRAYVQGSNSDTALACMNYAIGAIDGIYFYGGIDRQGPFCLPDEVTAGSAADRKVSPAGSQRSGYNNAGNARADCPTTMPLGIVCIAARRISATFSAERPKK